MSVPEFLLWVIFVGCFVAPLLWFLAGPAAVVKDTRTGLVLRTRRWFWLFHDPIHYEVYRGELP
jgi:hypothetical protein